jgi:peptidoglycan/xylan/chitin deacetylase (PgdA/CDA1 family)
MSGVIMAKAVITTSWDDGYPMDTRLAEMLTRHGLQGTFYIPRRGEWPVMPDAHIRSLAETHEVGGHTLNHVTLTAISDDEARREIIDGRDWLADVTGKPVVMFCPPRGKFKARHRKVIAETEFIGFRSVECWSIDTPRYLDNVMEMPTTFQAYPHGLRSHAANILKRRNGTGVGLLVRTYRRDWVSQALYAARLAIDANGVFHLWGHSWEIEQRNLWDALERVLAGLAELTPRATPMTNGQLCRHAMWSRLRRKHQAVAQGVVKPSDSAAAQDI